MKLHLLIASLLSPTLLQAELLITEVMSSSRHIQTTINGDWFELTNTGDSSINLSGYGFADSLLAIDRSIFASASLGAGESLIVLREREITSASTFRNTWGLPPSFPIFLRSQFTPEPGGLSSLGETLYLFNPSGVQIDAFEFGPASAGQSFARLQDGGLIPGGISTAGNFGAQTSMEVPADVASPGFVAEPASPLPPEFQGEPGVSVLVGTNISGQNFSLMVTDPNPEDTLTLTVMSKPDWLTVSALSNGSATLSGMPAAQDAGEATLTIELSDGVAETSNTTRIYRINVIPASSPIILNEYNAVDPDEFLDGVAEPGTAGAMDSFFGRILGNGGEWVEFVITGDGGPSLVDLSGATIELGSMEDGVFLQNNSRTLTTHPLWRDLPSGTILTFSDEETNLNRGGDLTADGYQSVNIQYEDLEFMEGTAQPAFDITPNNTAFRIRNRDGFVVFGPAGEGVGGLSGIGDTEILELEDDPSPTVTGLSVEGGGLDGYDPSSSSSTFGAPNLFATGPDLPDRAQNFSAFIGTRFERWLRSFGLPLNTEPNADSDGDGRSNQAEFLFGGDPTNSNSFPVTGLNPETGDLTFDIRANAGQFPTPRAERGSDLINWTTEEFSEVLEANIVSPIGAAFDRRSFRYEGSEPRMFFRVISPEPLSQSR